jgi:hypothetical protein
MNMKRIAAATAITAGLGLAGIGAASLAEAQPSAPLPDYHWCPGQWFDPAWGHNWDGGRCHDDLYFDGEPHDQGHWHGYGPCIREPANDPPNTAWTLRYFGHRADRPVIET